MITIPYTYVVLSFITIPYTRVALSFILLCGFWKMGQLDEEIGWAVGLAFGLLALVGNHFWPGGHAGLALHAVIGFVLLTVYKIVRGMKEKRDPEE